jgi:hypothetical protein
MVSTAAQIIIAVIPIVGIIVGGIVIFSFIYHYSKQRMLLIEKGLLHGKPFDFAQLSLFSGLVLTGIGFSLILFFVVMEGFTYGVLSGLIPFSIGIGMISFVIIKIRLFGRHEK